MISQLYRLFVYLIPSTVTDNDGLTHTATKGITVKKEASEESNLRE